MAEKVNNTFYLLLINFLGFPKPMLPTCAEALGMHSGLIPDSAVAASSSFDVTLAPKLGRLHYMMAGTGTEGVWAAQVSNAYQWLQVDMGNWTRVTGVATQGRQNADQWVASYSLSTSYGEFFEYVRNNSGEIKVQFLLFTAVS